MLIRRDGSQMEPKPQCICLPSTINFLLLSVSHFRARCNVDNYSKKNARF